MSSIFVILLRDEYDKLNLFLKYQTKNITLSLNSKLKII